jgi:myo-inositol-hexaphosphate 3-phosphohydrolase
MAVAGGVGVHVGGRVNGADVDRGCEVAVGLPQAGNNTISNEAINKNFLLMEWRILQVLRLTIY